jgi:trans-L-3-hydroxyproline dehydratase
MLEPRGHTDMYGALLTEPVTKHADAGILFMHNEGWSTMCGHGIIAVTTIALQRELIRAKAADKPGTVSVRYDTPAGVVSARARLAYQGEAMRVESVAFRNVPSFVFEPSVLVSIGGRRIPVDIAFGGAFYAIVDGEAAAVPLVRERFGELRALTRQIVAAVERQHTIVHPQQPGLAGLAGVIFTGPARGETSDLRSLVVYADGAVDRSPGGTATAAVMAVVDAMALLGDDRPFVQEGPIGTCFTGRVVERLDIAGFPAIVPEITGQAWITGEHTFLLDRDDPLRDGFDL